MENQREHGMDSTVYGGSSMGIHRDIGISFPSHSDTEKSSGQKKRKGNVVLVYRDYPKP